MQTVSVKVQIPDGWELACDEWRLPKAGEFYLAKDLVIEANYDLSQKHIIVRKIEPWKQPDFLNPGWIAMDENGDWFWFSNEPMLFSRCWDQCDCFIVELDCFNWTPPQCSDWKQSKRRIE